MTNFENMKQKIIGAVSRMDEMELLRMREGIRRVRRRPLQQRTQQPVP